MNPIAECLRDHAAQIDKGWITPTRMVVLFDEPAVIVQVGFTDPDKLNVLADTIAPLWREAIK